MHSYTEHDREDRKRFNSANEVVYAHDLRGNLTFLNQAGERISGYSREEACRMNIVEIVAPEIARHVREEITRNVTKRVGTVYEIEIIAKDGRRVPLEVSTRVIVRDGQLIEIEGIALPSALRGGSTPGTTPRCLDSDFFSELSANGFRMR